MATLEAVDQRITSHESECLRHKEFVSGEIKTLRAKVDNLEASKMSSSTFWIIMPIFSTAIFGVLGYIISIMNETRNAAIVTQVDVSMIKGKLDPYNVEFQK